MLQVVGYPGLYASAGPWQNRHRLSPIVFAQDGIAVTIGYFPEDDDTPEFVAQQTMDVVEVAD